ncbi:MAG TPA: hypothetical protein VGI47_07425 [Candidatus Binataceae bacterium]
MTLGLVFAGFAIPLATAELVGCGVKSGLRPPQEVQPEPITDLKAASVKDGIQLSWTRPMRYSGGGRMRDLSAFLVLRGEGNSKLSEVAQIPVTDRERFQVQHQFVFVDSSAVLGQAYRYDVLALTSDGYRSVSSNAVVISRAEPTPTPNPENFAMPTPTPVP